MFLSTGWVEEIRSAVGQSPLTTNLVAGGLAGLISRTTTAPLDRLKLLMQEGRGVSKRSSGMSIAQYERMYRTNHGVVAKIRQVYGDGGLRAFWRGNGANCAKIIPEQGLKFTLQSWLRHGIAADSENPNPLENMVAGAGAGLVTQLAIYPMEVVKTRLTVASSGEFRGMFDCYIRSVTEGGGVKSLYRGLWASLMGYVPYTALEMGIFFSLRDWYVRDRPHHEYDGLPAVISLSFSALASSFAQLVTYPMLLIRTRLQTQGVNNRRVRFNGMGHCARFILSQQGILGFYRGIWPNYAKALPATMIVYYVHGVASTWLFHEEEEAADGDVRP